MVMSMSMARCAAAPSPGARGDKEARIFVQRLEAELLAIAGHYSSARRSRPSICGSRRRSRWSTTSCASCRAGFRLEAETRARRVLGKVIVVTSGKGGVGKTTTTGGDRAGLALRGHKTVVIDFDVGLRNLDLVMGCERRVVYDFINVINGEAKLNQALIRDKRIDKLYVLPASQTRDKDALTREGVDRVIDELAPSSSTSSATARPASRTAR